MYPSYFTELAESDVTSAIEYISYTLNAPEAAKIYIMKFTGKGTSLKKPLFFFL
jgi:hypothetical protein